jgi:ribosomal protein L9
MACEVKDSLLAAHQKAVLAHNDNVQKLERLRPQVEKPEYDKLESACRVSSVVEEEAHLYLMRHVAEHKC